MNLRLSYLEKFEAGVRQLVVPSALESLGRVGVVVGLFDARVHQLALVGVAARLAERAHAGDAGGHLLLEVDELGTLGNAMRDETINVNTFERRYVYYSCRMAWDGMMNTCRL